MISRLGSQSQRVEATGRKPRRLLRRYLNLSYDSRTALIDGRPVAMWGYIGSEIGTEAYVWFCLADDVRRLCFRVAYGAIRELNRVMAAKRTINGKVICSDERAKRFARFLGFEVREHETTNDDGLLCHPMRLVRDGGPPFMIYALPRSRTAWLSRFLSYGAWTCHHESSLAMRSMDDVSAFFRQPNTGAADTAAAWGWRILKHRFPDMKMVVVRRPVDDVVSAVLSMDVGDVVTFDAVALRKKMEYGARMLDQISAQPGVLTVNFTDLNQPETCATIFEHCLPYRFDREWWEGLRGQNVQADAGGMMAFYHQNKVAIEAFKRACMSELRSLARSGAIAGRS